MSETSQKRRFAADGGVPEDAAECEECGELIDFTTAEPFWKTADDRFWHDGCHDPTVKLDRVEEIRDELIAQLVPEDCFDGLSNDFYDRLDQIQVDLDEAVRRERLRHEQQARTDGGQRAPHHGPEYARQQAHDHRDMERRNLRRQGYTSGGRRL